MDVTKDTKWICIRDKSVSFIRQENGHNGMMRFQLKGGKRGEDEEEQKRL